MTLDGTATTIDAAGDLSTAHVGAQPECAWTASADVNWINEVTPASGQGAADVRFRVVANTDPSARQGSLSVNGVALRVSQAAMPCRFEVQPRSATVLRAGGNVAITIAAPAACAWSASTEASWLSLNPASGSGNATVTITAPANPGLARIASATVAGVSVLLSQEAALPVDCTATLQPASQSSPAAGGAGTPVTVTLPATCAWTAVSDVGWIAVTSSPSATGSGSVTFTVATNSGAERTGTISIAGQRATVSQAAAAAPSPPPPPPPAPCSYGINPTSTAADPAGGPLTPITVTAGVGCGWTAVSNTGWISVTNGAAGSGNGSVSLTTIANPGAARSGTVTIAGQTLDVSQAAPPCSYAINPTSEQIAAAGGTGATIAVTTTTALCGWTAVANDGWLSVTNGATGNGNGTVMFSVAANTGAARTGTLTVATRTYTVSQDAAPPPPPPPCSFQIAPTSQSIPAAGVTGASVTVTTTAACNWTAVSNDSWLSITTGASGMGSGTVTFDAEANTGGADRTGTLTIAGQTFTVAEGHP